VHHGKHIDIVKIVLSVDRSCCLNIASGQILKLQLTRVFISSFY